MKRVKILVCGFSLAIALVALPFPYIDDITSGLGFSIAAVLFAWPKCSSVSVPAGRWYLP